jgi:hypothetical protein
MIAFQFQPGERRNKSNADCNQQQQLNHDHVPLLLTLMIGRV